MVCSMNSIHLVLATAAIKNDPKLDPLFTTRSSDSSPATIVCVTWSVGCNSRKMMANAEIGSDDAKVHATLNYYVSPHRG